MNPMLLLIVGLALSSTLAFANVSSDLAARVIRPVRQRGGIRLIVDICIK
jgi:hypothetical protein